MTQPFAWTATTTPPAPVGVRTRAPATTRGSRGGPFFDARRRFGAGGAAGAGAGASGGASGAGSGSGSGAGTASTTERKRSGVAQIKPSSS